MQHLEVSGAVRPIYGSLGTTYIWVVRRQTVKEDDDDYDDDDYYHHHHHHHQGI